MYLMRLVVRLRMPSCTTGRLKRLCSDSIVDVIHRNFNVSIAEIGPDKPHDALTFAACCVARKKDQARRVLERVADALCTHPEAELLANPEYTKR